MDLELYCLGKLGGRSAEPALPSKKVVVPLCREPRWDKERNNPPSFLFFFFLFDPLLESIDWGRRSKSLLSGVLSKRPSVEAERDSLIAGESYSLNADDFSDLGSDVDRLSGGIPMSTTGGPGDIGLPSTHKSVDFDRFPLKSDLSDLRKEQLLASEPSSSSSICSMRLFSFCLRRSVLGA